VILTADDRAFGRLEGKVDETIDRVGRIAQAIAHMGAASSAEHATVEHELGKEFREGLERRDEQIDSLESTRDEGSGAARLPTAQWLPLSLTRAQIP
jgi:hypothetical protein